MHVVESYGYLPTQTHKIHTTRDKNVFFLLGIETEQVKYHFVAMAPCTRSYLYAYLGTN